MTRTFKFFAFCAAAATLPLSTAVVAQAHDEPISVEVSYADLNLLNDEGVKRLDQRLKSAVTTVCGGSPWANMVMRVPIRRCQKETTANVAPVRDEVVEAARSGRRGTVDIAKLIVKRPKSSK